MTAGQVALFLWVSSFVVPVRYLYRRLRRVRVEVSLNDLRTRGVDVSLPSDWLGATCCAGFELGDSAGFADGNAATCGFTTTTSHSFPKVVDLRLRCDVPTSCDSTGRRRAEATPLTRIFAFRLSVENGWSDNSIRPNPRCSSSSQ